MIIVAAALLIRDGKLLISQRLKNAHGGLCWEFPGGKLEPSESPEEALERELFEELGIKTKTGRIYDVIRHTYEDREVLLLFYKAQWIDGEPQAIESERIEWVTPDKLCDYSFVPADERLIRRIEREGLDI